MHNIRTCFNTHTYVSYNGLPLGPNCSGCNLLKMTGSGILVGVLSDNCDKSLGQRDASKSIVVILLVVPLLIPIITSAIQTV